MITPSTTIATASAVLFLLVCLFDSRVNMLVPCVTTSAASRHWHWTTHCFAETPQASHGCYPSQECGPKCGRALIDDFITSEEAERLRDLADRALSRRGRVGGPAIVDLLSGFIRDSNGLGRINDGLQDLDSIESHEYGFYRGIIERIRLTVIKIFDLEELFFTAPTFITRITASEQWEPQGPHDQYWHPHVDQMNTVRHQVLTLKAWKHITSYNIERSITTGPACFIYLLRARISKEENWSSTRKASFMRSTPISTV
eukprot:scaffold164_cov340-Pinguiococcus_pyrenoidosus.AAC.10